MEATVGAFCGSATSTTTSTEEMSIAGVLPTTAIGTNAVDNDEDRWNGEENELDDASDEQDVDDESDDGVDGNSNNVRLPHWLEDHCRRLQGAVDDSINDNQKQQDQQKLRDTNVSNLNLNIRRLTTLSMMKALAVALVPLPLTLSSLSTSTSTSSSPSYVTSLNLTSTLSSCTSVTIGKQGKELENVVSKLFSHMMTIKKKKKTTKYHGSISLSSSSSSSSLLSKKERKIMIQKLTKDYLIFNKGSAHCSNPSDVILLPLVLYTLMGGRTSSKSSSNHATTKLHPDHSTSSIPSASASASSSSTSPSSSLKTLHLSYNRLQQAGIAIGMALKNDIDETGSTLSTITTLKRGISSSSCSLQELYLDYNQLTTASACAIAEGLAENTTLKVLQLNYNKIGDIGGQAIAKALGKSNRRRRLRRKKRRSNDRHDGKNNNNTEQIPRIPSSSSSYFFDIEEDSYSTSGLETLGLKRNPIGSLTLQAFYHTLNEDNNVTLTHLSLDDIRLSVRQQDDPNMVRDNGDDTNSTSCCHSRSHRRFHPFSVSKIKYLVRANQVGRYLLQQPQKRQEQQGQEQQDVPHGLWPILFEQLEADMIYFFLLEKPELMMK